MSQPDRPWWSVLVLLAAICATVLAACGATVNSPSPSPTGSPPPGPAAVIPPTACLTLGEADCRRAATAAVDALGAGDPEPIYLQVGPFGCRTGERCPATLAARPEGDVIVEFAGVPAIAFHLVAAVDGSVRAARAETSGIILEPSSGPLGRPGPIPFTLGHCGIFSGIDVDASWWDPVGVADFEHGDAINAAAGTLTFRDPTHATFVSGGGLIVELQRRVGSKHLPFCD